MWHVCQFLLSHQQGLLEDHYLSPGKCLVVILLSTSLGPHAGCPATSTSSIGWTSTRSRSQWHMSIGKIALGKLLMNMVCLWVSSWSKMLQPSFILQLSEDQTNIKTISVIIGAHIRYTIRVWRPVTDSLPVSCRATSQWQSNTVWKTHCLRLRVLSPVTDSLHLLTACRSL